MYRNRLKRLIDRLSILEPENPSTFSNNEIRIRKLISVLWRFLLASVAAWHVFEFLFSSIWMHGYIWSLNLPIDLDMSDKSAGNIVYHQMEMVGSLERFFHAGLVVLSTSILLILSGFASNQSISVWYLLKLSANIGLICGLIRPLQMKQRLFSSLHEGFYSYFVFFVVGLFLCLRPLEALPDSVQKSDESNAEISTENLAEIEETVADDINNNCIEK